MSEIALQRVIAASQGMAVTAGNVLRMLESNPPRMADGDEHDKVIAARLDAVDCCHRIIAAAQQLGRDSLQVW